MRKPARGADRNRSQRLAGTAARRARGSLAGQSLRMKVALMLVPWVKGWPGPEVLPALAA